MGLWAAPGARESHPNVLQLFRKVSGAPGVAKTPKIVILQSSNNVGPPPPLPYAREKVKIRLLRGRCDFDVLKNRQNL